MDGDVSKRAANLDHDMAKRVGLVMLENAERVGIEDDKMTIHVVKAYDVDRDVQTVRIEILADVR